MRRRAPRPLGAVLERLSAELAPPTTLARLQSVWREAVGEQVAAEASPVAERDGRATVACRSAVWAQELDLMSPDLVDRLNDALEGAGAPRSVTALRFVVRDA